MSLRSFRDQKRYRCGDLCVDMRVYCIYHGLCYFSFYSVKQFKLNIRVLFIPALQGCCTDPVAISFLSVSGLAFPCSLRDTGYFTGISRYDNNTNLFLSWQVVIKSYVDCHSISCCITPKWQHILMSYTVKAERQSIQHLPETQTSYR